MLPNICISLFPSTVFTETIFSWVLSALMMSSKNGSSFTVTNLRSRKQSKLFQLSNILRQHTLLQIKSFVSGDLPPILNSEIMKSSLRISTDRDWTSNVLYLGFFIRISLACAAAGGCSLQDRPAAAALVPSIQSWSSALCNGGHRRGDLTPDV